MHRIVPLSGQALHRLTAILFGLASLLGGGQGWVGERLLVLPAMVLALLAIVDMHSDPQSSVGQHRWFYMLPALLLVLPLLQLVPLPYGLWSRLPGRGPLADALHAAGVVPAWTSWSVVPIETERRLESLLVPVGLYMAVLRLDSAQQRRVVVLALGIAILNVLVGLLQLLQGPDSLLYFYTVTNSANAVGLFANRNHFASLAAVSLPLAAGLLADRLRGRHHSERDPWVWLLTAAIVILSVGVTAASSRAAFLLLMLSVFAAAALLWQGRHEVAHWGHTGRWLRLGAALALVLIVQYTLYALLLRLQADPLEDVRWQYAPQSLQVAAATRGLGYGFGSFLHAFDQIGDASADRNTYVNHAHNDYVELWLEGGLPALLLALLAVVAVAAQVRRQWRAQWQQLSLPPRQRDHERALALGAACALALLLLHSAVDYPLRTLSLQSLAAVLAALLVGSRQGIRS